MDETTYLIETIIEGKNGKCEKYFTKIKFNSNDNLPLTKMVKIHKLKVIVRYVFEKDDKYHPQVFLDECL